MNGLFLNQPNQLAFHYSQGNPGGFQSQMPPVPFPHQKALPQEPIQALGTYGAKYTGDPLLDKYIQQFIG